MFIKMVKKEIVEEIMVPEKVTLKLENGLLSAEGPKGKAERKCIYPGLSVKVEGSKVVLSINKASKREKAVINAYKAHINNLFKGVLEGFTYKLKICSGHFPMTVSYKNNVFTIKNFIGEKVPRTVTLSPDVKVNVSGDLITIEGCDKEICGQAAARIEQRTRRPGYDKRIFQDGIYITAKNDKDV